MADKARPCPCTNPELRQFKWVSTSYPIAGRVLKALHTDESILTGEECSECGTKNWYTLAAIVIATKSTGDVQRALDVVRQQRPTGDVNEDYYLKHFVRLLQVLSTLYQEKMVTEQEMEDLKPNVLRWRHLVVIWYTKPPDVVKRTAELLAEVGRDEHGKQLKVLSTLYQEKMVTEQEVKELKPAVLLWSHIVCIQCTKPPDVVKRTTELLAEVGRNEEGKEVKVLAALYQKKVIAEHDLQIWKGSASDMLLDLIFDLCTRPSEDVATAADVLDMVGWKNEAEMLRVLSVLYQNKVIDHREVMKMHREMLGHVPRTDEALWQELVNVQCRKPPEVVTATAAVLDELGLKEKATELRGMSELYQKGLISEDDLRRLSRRHYTMGYSSRHWLDSLVNIQSSKSADVHARTFDTLKSFSLTEVVQERQTKHTDVSTEYGSLKLLHSSSSETSEMLPSSDTMMILKKWGRLSEHLLSKEPTTSDPLEILQPSHALTSSSHYPIKTLKWPQTLSEHPPVKESQLVPSLEELSVSPSKTKVSSLHAGGGSDPPEREDVSNLLTDEAALKRFCWIPFDIKTVSIEAKGGILCLEPTSDDIQVAKEDTIFVEVPPDAVSTSADVKMRYAIIPSGPFTLPEGYQFGSPVVYIYYDGRRVTKPLALHLPHWYGGEDHARDGLSFAVAPHSLKGGSVYHFQLLAGGKFSVSSRYRVVEIGGHCSLFTKVFKLGNRTTENYQAVCLEKEEGRETVCDIAVTYAITNWLEILKKYRPGWKLIKSSSFIFKSDRITATLEQSCHDDWHAVFRGPSELLSRQVRYDCHSITSSKLLEEAVKESSYPPSITCVVMYNKELRSTGRPTEVELHISGMDPEMKFQCTAYERIQAAPPTTILSPTQTETTSQPSMSLCEAALLTPTPVSPAQSTHTGAAHTLPVCSPFSGTTSFAPPPHTPGSSPTPPTHSEGAVQTGPNPAAATPKGAAPTGTNAADGQDGTTTQLKPRFAILTANDNERDAVRNYLGLDHRLSATDRDASVCSYREDAFLKVNKASISMNEQTLSYSTFTIEFGGKKVAGVHIHCDRYGPWGAFDKTVQLLTDAKSNGWSLKTVFVVGCCGASMTKEIKEKKTWCGTVLLADEVKGYLHTGKVENAEGVNGSESQVEFLGQPVSLEMDMKWLQSLSTVAKTIYDTGFRNIEVKKTMYLSGPLVIKNQLFGDYCRGGHTIAGVEMEVIGVIKAVKAIHQYSKDECPEIVLAKGISDCTSDKAEKTKCMFFGKEKTECGDKERQVYATLQSIALVIRCVASNIQEFC